VSKRWRPLFILLVRIIGQRDFWTTLDGGMPFGMSTGKCVYFLLESWQTDTLLTFVVPFHFFPYLFSQFLERYQQCGTAEEVEETQKAVMEELEQSWEESRQLKGIFFHFKS